MKQAPKNFSFRVISRCFLQSNTFNSYNAFNEPVSLLHTRMTMFTCPVVPTQFPYYVLTRFPLCCVFAKVVSISHKVPVKCPKSRTTLQVIINRQLPFLTRNILNNYLIKLHQGLNVTKNDLKTTIYSRI
jgi:hypothetical protein